MLSFRHTKQTSKNVVDTTFKYNDLKTIPNFASNISEETEVNSFAKVRLILEVKFGDNLLPQRFPTLFITCGMGTKLQLKL